MPSSARLQQHATRAAFFLPGFAIAAWAPIVPYAKLRSGLDEAGLGLVLLCLGAGSLLAMPLAGVATARRGARAVMLATIAITCAALPLLAVADGAVALAVALFVFGAGIGATDCSMNIQAVAVERDAGRAMMSGFHAFYSIGGFAGAAGTTALLGAGFAPWQAALAVAAATCAIAALAASHWRAERVASDAPAFALPRGVVVSIGALAFVVFLAEGAVLDWSAVFLTDVRGIDASRAGSGFAVFSLAMTLARLFGDRVVQRLGHVRASVAGACVAAAGLLLATLVPVFGVALAGYALLGLGCANIVPVLFSLAGRQRAMPEAAAITAVTTVGYAGILAGPAAIGFVAHATSLPVAFLCIVAGLLAVAVSMPRLRG